jgi:uncharacterized damage-inducible protein DinB
MLEDRLQRFEAVRSRTCKQVAGLDQATMNRKPDAKTWSPGELVDHVLVTERLYRGEIAQMVELARQGRRPYLNRLLSDLPFPFLDFFPREMLSLASVPLTFINVFVPTFAVEAFLRTPFVSAVAPPALQPSAGRDAEALRRDLVESAAETRHVFDANRDLDFRRFTYQHPVLGLVDGEGMLRILISHEQRHQDQLDRILKALGG